MGISVIKVTNANLMEIIADESVYVIKNHWAGNGYDMVPVGKANVSDLLSENVLIVKIEKND